MPDQAPGQTAAGSGPVVRPPLGVGWLFRADVADVQRRSGVAAGGAARGDAHIGGWFRGPAAASGGLGATAISGALQGWSGGSAWPARPPGAIRPAGGRRPTPRPRPSAGDRSARRCSRRRQAVGAGRRPSEQQIGQGRVAGQDRAVQVGPPDTPDDDALAAARRPVADARAAPGRPGGHRARASSPPRDSRSPTASVGTARPWARQPAPRRLGGPVPGCWCSRAGPAPGGRRRRDRRRCGREPAGRRRWPARPRRPRRPGAEGVRH